MKEGRRILINGSAHNIPLPDGMFHTSCTSPPYYSLRKYAGEQAIDWPAVEYAPMTGLPALTIPAMTAPLGLEPTPEAFIGHLVLCFREVKRVLRDDGVAWAVIGDSYASQGGPEPAQTKWQVEGASNGQNAGRSRTTGQLKPGDLMLIPHRLALALQADGWTVRNDVVWAKKNPMPESVSGPRWERCKIKVVSQGGNMSGMTYRQMTERDGDWTNETHPGTRKPAGWSDCPGCDKCEANGGYVLRRGSWRHTRAHEFVFMLTKGMGYWSDVERVREASQDLVGGGQPMYSPKTTKCGKMAGTNELIPYERGSGRNPRSVLSPSPEQYKGAHYAVYPRTLISPLLQATAPSRVCPACGAPWVVVVERQIEPDGLRNRGDNTKMSFKPTQIGSGQKLQDWKDANPSLVLGHRPACACPTHDPIPGWCLDPFAGTFTTGAVCAELGVNAVGLDISAEYLDKHAKSRIGLTSSAALNTLPMFESLPCQPERR